jgi:hypothetical protein
MNEDMTLERQDLPPGLEGPLSAEGPAAVLVRSDLSPAARIEGIGNAASMFAQSMFAQSQEALAAGPLRILSEEEMA